MLNLRHRAPAVGLILLALPLAWAGPYASLLVRDLSTGATLVSEAPDVQRAPASLAKLMTLYLLFERIDAGTVRLDQQFAVSRNAALQPPTKLGLRAGRTLTAEECIEALVLKSANNVAVVVAEALGGDETAFAGMMNAKARELGMRETVFRNASGLPDAAQVTTSRDLSILVAALLEKHPRFYPYFELRTCKLGNRTLVTHNEFLVAYDGAEGMKTGYTRDAGYNLVATAQRGGHRLLGVILGAEGPRRRESIMARTMDSAFHELGVAPPEPKATAAGARRRGE